MIESDSTFLSCFLEGRLVSFLAGAGAFGVDIVEDRISASIAGAATLAELAPATCTTFCKDGFSNTFSALRRFSVSKSRNTAKLLILLSLDTGV